MGSPSPDLTPLTEDEAHRVLARAVELDARAATEISVAQLQQIADEAGIGADSLARALQEWRAGRELPAPLARGAALAEQLRRFRGPAVAVFFFAAAVITPGDVLAINLAYVLPAMAIYEIVLRIARGQSRSGPPSSPRTDQPLQSTPAPARVRDGALRIEALALHLRPIAPAHIPAR